MNKCLFINQNQMTVTVDVSTRNAQNAKRYATNFPGSPRSLNRPKPGSFINGGASEKCAD